MNLYGFLQTIFPPLFRWLFSLQVVGAENLPKTGGAIIASNHISLWDPPLLGTALPRPIHFMAKQELFENPVLAWVIKQLNAFPVQRGSADRVAIRKALALLEQQKIVGIFPEGTRSKTGELGMPEPGMALIAAKAGVPIVPTAIFGTNQFQGGFPLPNFSVVVGAPIYPEPGKNDRESLDRLSQAVMRSINELLNSRKP